MPRKFSIRTGIVRSKNSTTKIRKVIALTQEFTSCYVRNANSDLKGNANPSNYLVNNFINTFPKIIGTMSQLTKLIRLSNP